MKKKYGITGVLLVVALLLFAACGSGVIDTSLGSLSCLPDDYTTFVYIKNFPRIKEIFDRSEFATELKDNYVYLDLKYKYSQSVDLFFVKVDLDPEALFTRVNRDLLMGLTKDSFFVVASLDFQSQLIYSLFNLLPDAYIQKSRIMGQEVGSFNKNGREIYFSFQNGYLVLAGDRNTMAALLDSKRNKNAEGGALIGSCTDEDIYIRTSMPKDYNPFDLLPHLGKISVRLNLSTFHAALEAEPTRHVSFSKPQEEYEYFQFLKYLPPDFALCYFNREYEAAEVLRRIFLNYEHDSRYAYRAEENIKELEVFNNFSDGACFAFKTLGYGRGSNEMAPGLAFALRLKEGIAAGDLASIYASVFRVFNFLFGFSGWDREPHKNYTIYNCRDNDFHIIVFNRYIILCSSRNISGDIAQRIDAAQASLYDTLFAEFKSSGRDDLVYYMAVNMHSLFSELEPVFSDYIRGRLDMDRGEYDNSFGQFIGFLKDREPLYISLSENKNKGMYTGEVKFIK
jgi:hypothetical protein